MTCANMMHVLLMCALVVGSALEVVANTDEIIYNECPKEDIGNITIRLAHETDCTKYYDCSGGNKYHKECPIMDLKGNRLYFNSILQVCDWPQNVNCKKRKENRIADFKIDIPTKCPEFDSIHFTVHLAHETDCTKFYKCDHRKKVEMDCPLANALGDKLHFNAALQVCDWPESSGCQSASHTTPSLTTSSSTSRMSTTPALPTPSSTNPLLTTPSINSNSCEGDCPRENDLTYISTLPHKENCSEYCLCVNGISHVMDCPSGLVYDKLKGICDFSSDGECNVLITTVTATSETTLSPTTPLSTTLSSTSSSSTTPSSTTPSSTTPAVSDSSCKGTCPNESDLTYIPTLPHEADCTKYCLCVNGTSHVMDCPAGLAYDELKGICDFSSDGDCNVVTTSETPSSTTLSSTTSLSMTPSSTTPSSTTPFSTTPSSTTPAISDSSCKGSCPNESDLTYIPTLPHKEDCTKYCHCVNGTSHVMDCPAGLAYDELKGICDFPLDGDCNVVTTSETPSSTTLSSTTSLSMTPSSTTPLSTTPSSTTPSSTTPFSTTPSSTTPAISDSSCKGTCPNESDLTYIPTLPHKEDCTKYCLCVNGTSHVMDCPAGLAYDELKGICDFPSDGDCNVVTTSVTPSSTTLSSTTPSSMTSSSPTSSSTTPSATTPLSTTPSATTPSSTTPSSITPSSTTPAISDSSCKGTCPNENDLTYIPTLPYKEDCTKYCLCVNGTSDDMDCPAGLAYDELKGICDFPSDGDCNVVTTSETPSSTTLSSTTSLSMTPSSTTPSSTTPSSTTPSSTTPAISDSSCKGSCPNESDLTYIPTLPHKEDCTKYCLCVNGTSHVMDCPAGLAYDELKGICDFPLDGDCNVVTTSETPTPETPTPETPTPETPTPETPTPETPTPETPTPETPTPETPTPETPTPETPTPETPTPETPTPETPTPETPTPETPSPETSTSETPTPSTTTSGPPSNNGCIGSCPKMDPPTTIHLPNENCTKFCKCSNGKEYIFDCPSGLYFNPTLSVCDWPEKAKCVYG